MLILILCVISNTIVSLMAMLMIKSEANKSQKK